MSKVFVYAVKSPRAVKIGISENVKNRVRELQRGNPDQLTVVRQQGPYPRQHAKLFEDRIHEKSASFQIMGEWFSLEALVEFDTYFSSEQHCTDQKIIINSLADSQTDASNRWSADGKRIVSRQAFWGRKMAKLRREQGLCICGQEPDEGYKTCRRCRDRRNKYQKKWYKKTQSATTKN